MTRKILLALLVTIAALALAGCSASWWTSGPKPPPLPPRARVAAGPGYAAATAYLDTHRVKVPKGMQAGILVTSDSPGWASVNLNGGAWSGVVVIAGGWTETLSSDEGDGGMATFAQPGDLLEFPAGNIPVDAPGDDVINGQVAKILARGVVTVP
jgi:hypothetical protein